MGKGCVGKLPIMYLAHPEVLWACFVACCVWVVFGCLGNSISFLILGCNKSRRNQSCGFYLRALAVADGSALLFSTFFMSVQMMLRPATRMHHLNPIALLVNSYPLCNLRIFVSYSCSLIATYIIVLFSVERCLVVASPLRFMRTFTLRRARWAVATLVLLSCVVCTPALFSFHRYDYWSATAFNQSGGGVAKETKLDDIKAQVACRVCMNCSRPGGAEWSGSRLVCESYGLCRIDLNVFKGFAFFHTIAQSVVALLITGVCNVIIIAAMQRRDPQKLNTSGNSDENQDRQITRRLILVSTVFIILSFPLTFYQGITFLMTGSYCGSVAADALTITLMLNAGNFAANFYIYCISEHQFRKVVLAVLKCKGHRLNRLLSYANEPASRQRYQQRSDTPTRNAPVTTSSNVRRSSDISAAETAIVQQHDQQQQQQQQPLIDSNVADYVRARHQKQQEEECNDCSIARDDWSSSMFAEADSHPEVVRWSQVAPE